MRRGRGLMLLLVCFSLVFVCSLSDSETLPELSMSDFDRGTVLSYSHSPESSLPSLPYELQSLSGQLEALGQSGETLPEEEEPLPEEPLPFSEGQVQLSCY